ncbi:MAG: CBS domain-containing protein [Anaerolineales bacterium]|nr:CBS domain-containing protein [Anaerolineales bacterium]
MFVGERMSRPVITISPEAPINDVLAMFRKEHISRAPVVKDGKLVGIVTENDLIHASPSALTTLSVWEMHYLISKIKIKDVMTKKVITVDRNTPIEEAARIMADKQIGGLPVMEDKKVVGLITETDLFKLFLELMGARDKGIRVTASVESKPGQLAKITKAIAHAGGNFISFGFFDGEDVTSKIVTFKVEGIKKDDIKPILKNIVKKFWDIRVC